jgi:hypothetical protein
MAIHPDLPGVEVVVCVNGVPLEEFNDDETESEIAQPAGNVTKKISKYVKSVEDQEFVIRWTLRAPFEMDCPAVTAYLYLDGKLLFRRIIEGKNYKPEIDFVSRIQGVIIEGQGDNQQSFQPFKFSKVKTSKLPRLFGRARLLTAEALDDEAYARVEKDKKHMADVGSIKVDLVRKGEPRQVPHRPQNFSNFGVFEVHEKALKGQPKYHAVS